MAERVQKWKADDGALFDTEAQADEHDNKDRIRNEVKELVQSVYNLDQLTMDIAGVTKFICNHTVVLQEIFTRVRRC